MDYTEYLPTRPPERVIEAASKKPEWPDWLIYRSGWWTEPMTGLRQTCVDATCTACGQTMQLPKSYGAHGSAPFGWFDYSTMEKVGNNDETFCPECGAKVTALHIGHTSWAQSWAWVMDAEKLDLGDGATPRLLLTLWRANKYALKAGAAHIEVEPYEAYIVDEKKIIRCVHWYRTMGGRTYCCCKWEQRKTFNDGMMEIRVTTGNVAEAMKGTVAENSKLDMYMALNRERFPVAYLRIWQKHPNVETLITAGAGNILADLIREEKENRSYYGGDYRNNIPQLKALSWKKKRPSELLGMDREQLRQVRDKLTGKGLLNWLDTKDSGLFRLPEDVNKLNDLSDSDKEIVKFGLRPDKAQRYIQAQKKKWPSDKVTASDFRDYLRMAADIPELRDVKLPSRLKSAHDQAILLKQYKESPQLKSGFKRRAKELKEWEYEADGYRVIAPQNESDLIKEGKLLGHCVATYATSHATGRTVILLIRRAEEPERPYFTLNLSPDGMTMIQNRGRQNCAPPEEVKTFTEKYLKWLKDKLEKRKETAA